MHEGKRKKQSHIVCLLCTERMNIFIFHLFFGLRSQTLLGVLSSFVRSKFAFRDHVDSHLNIYSLVKYMEQMSRSTSVKTRLWTSFCSYHWTCISGSCSLDSVGTVYMFSTSVQEFVIWSRVLSNRSVHVK